MLGKIKKSIKKRGRELNRFLRGGKKILVLGDSHGGVFEYMYDRGFLSPHVINVEVVGGATAYGLSKESSSTNAFRIFTDAIARFGDYETILIMLGEVDCSFVLWKKAEQNQESVFKQIKYSMDGYKKLLEWIKADGKRRVILLGAVLPTIKDGEKAPKGAELRDCISASQKERTELVLRFNDEIEGLAKAYGFEYCDITDETIDKNSGLLDNAYLCDGDVDHHQSQEKTASIWAEKIKLVFNEHIFKDKS